MTYEETIKLIDAGYTKEEIKAFESEQSGGAKTEDEPKDKSTDDPKAKTETKVTDDHKATDTSAMNNEVFKDLVNSVKELKDTVKAIQDNAAKTAKVETPTDSSIENLIADFTKNM